MGSSVTLEQAEEILIRTATFHFSTNDRTFLRELYKTLDIELETNFPWPKWESMEAVEKKYGVLDLEYLHNEQIVSAYVGGPHGWCDWEGNIFCNSFNIGKWPSVESVYREWKLIASAFPFLQLMCQLFNGETCEDELPLEPVVQFNVGGGTVWLCEPDKEPIGKPVSTLDTAMFGLLNPGCERGCTLGKFKHALETTLKAVNHERVG